MENIEELKQANEKLTERLNNAAKFFREQKAQIETLTKENEELKKNQNVVDYDEEIKKYKNTTNLLNKSIDELNNQIKERDSKITKLEEDLQSRIDQIRATEKTYDEEQKKIISARDEWMKKYNELKPQYDEVFKASQDLGKELAESQAKYLQELSNRDKDLQDSINTCKKANEKIEDLKIQIDQFKKDNKEIQDKYNNLDKSYNDLENHKLAIENDYNELEKKYQQVNNELQENTKDINLVTNAYESLRKFFKQDEVKVVNKVEKKSTDPMTPGMHRMA